MRRNGLKKYDAPLRIQYEWGYEAFKKGGSFKKIGKKTIGAVANCHTIPVIWDWDLTNKQWENLFDFEAQRDYVDDIVQRRYKTLYGTKDTNI